MNAEKFFETFKKHLIIKEGDDFIIFGLPFFHLGHPDGIALRFSVMNGYLVVSDCRTTTEYLDAEGIDLEDYPEKLLAIMKKFGLFFDGSVFRKILYNTTVDDEIDFTPVGYFIEAISLIAHINM